MVDYQTIGVMIAAASVVIGVINSIYSSRIAERQRQTEIETRQAQLFEQVYSQWTGGIHRQWSEISRWEWDNYDDFMQKYGNLESRIKLGSVGGYFEGIGVFVREGLVPIRLVALFITTVIKNFWEKFGPIAKENRVRNNSPRIAIESEYLYNVLMKYIEEHPEFRG